MRQQEPPGANPSMVCHFIRTDRAAEVMLLRLYERRPGQRPATPVTILSAETESTVVLAAEISSHLRRYIPAPRTPRDPHCL